MTAVIQYIRIKEVNILAAVTEEYKDRLFCFIFGSKEHKDWTLSLYNAVNNTSYTDPEAITIATLTQVLYMGMQDDVALLIFDELNLYEHQSSYNPNMPLRLMQYTSNIYETLITLQKKNKYGSKLIPLPVPKLVTFYNGMADKPEELILHLSDSFPEDKRDESDIQVQVRMLNINPGHNLSMVTKCKPLEEYTWTVAAIRENRKQMDIERAIDKALDDMPDDFEIKPFLSANRVGVKKMLLTEYNETETMELFKEEGCAEGKDEANISNIRKIMAKMKLSAKKAMDFMDISSEDQQRYAPLLKEHPEL